MDPKREHQRRDGVGRIGIAWIREEEGFGWQPRAIHARQRVAEQTRVRGMAEARGDEHKESWLKNGGQVRVWSRKAVRGLG